MSQRKKTIRSKFRHEVFTRDGFKCVFCGEQSSLHAHHITDRSFMPNGGYVLENGITLCAKHHLLAEKYHMSGEAWPGYSPKDLYKKIHSSLEKATVNSARLDRL